MPKKKKTTKKKKTEPIEKIGDVLTLKQEKFCQLYATDKEFFGNGAQAYIEAYQPNQKAKNWYKTVCQSASRLLSNVKVCNRINEFLTIDGFNENFMDKQLLYVATQHNDLGAKVNAVREFNKLKNRIKTKLGDLGDDLKITKIIIENPNANA